LLAGLLAGSSSLAAAFIASGRHSCELEVCERSCPLALVEASAPLVCAPPYRYSLVRTAARFALVA
jgi:hypothetical protein